MHSSLQGLAVVRVPDVRRRPLTRSDDRDQLIHLLRETGFPSHIVANAAHAVHQFRTPYQSLKRSGDVVRDAFSELCSCLLEHLEFLLLLCGKILGRNERKTDLSVRPGAEDGKKQGKPESHSSGIVVEAVDHRRPPEVAETRRARRETGAPFMNKLCETTTAPMLAKTSSLRRTG